MNPKLVTKRDDSDPNMCFRYFWILLKPRSELVWIGLLGFFYSCLAETESKPVTINILCGLVLKVHFYVSKTSKHPVWKGL